MKWFFILISLFLILSINPGQKVFAQNDSVLTKELPPGSNNQDKGKTSFFEVILTILGVVITPILIGIKKTQNGIKISSERQQWIDCVLPVAQKIIYEIERKYGKSGPIGITNSGKFDEAKNNITNALNPSENAAIEKHFGSMNKFVEYAFQSTKSTK